MSETKGRVKKSFAAVLDKLFRTVFAAVAAVAFVSSACVHFLWSQNGQIDLISRTLSCSNALETAVLPDGACVLNDSAERIMCIEPDGSLRYRIDGSERRQMTGLTADENGNIYFFLSEYDSSGVSRDDIEQYDKNGRFVRTLYQIDYSDEQRSEHTVRTSPLFVESGGLFFTRYFVYETDVYRLDLASGKAELAGRIKSGTPFEYTDVQACDSGSYCYAKISGEVGRGVFGGAETALYSGSYSLEDDSGFRPFYVRSLAGRVYVYDYWSAKIWEVKDGALFEPDWQSDFAYNDEPYDLSVTNGSVCGLTGGVPWAVSGGKLRTLASSAQVSFFTAAGEAVMRAFKSASSALMWTAAAYMLAFVIWRVLIRGKRIAWKLLVFEFMTTAVLFALLYAGVSSRYQSYIRESLGFLEKSATLSAQIFDADDLGQIDSSADAASDGYKKISRLIVDNFGLYESESDTAAVLMKSVGGGYGIVASNRGYGDIFGSSAQLAELIEKSGGSAYAVYSPGDGLLFAVAPVVSGENTAGWLCLYTTAENIRGQFFSMWSPYTLAGYFALLCLFFLLSTVLLTRRLKKVTGGINQIARGDFTMRIPDGMNDEMGTLIGCVNDLSKSIEGLIHDKVELTEEVRKSQYEVLSSLASIVENKSGATAAHVERVSQCVHIMAADLGFKGHELEYVSIAAMLHDVGKLFVPAEILDKPGKLTPEEFGVVKRHTVDGERLLKNAPGRIMYYARIIALEHHEKWDGTGYMGLKGESIHLEARITAVADVFDALMSKRAYKEAFSKEKTFEIITSQSGMHFDPRIVEIFMRHFAELVKVVEDNPDTPV